MMLSQSQNVLITDAAWPDDTMMNIIATQLNFKNALQTYREELDSLGYPRANSGFTQHIAHNNPGHVEE